MAAGSKMGRFPAAIFESFTMQTVTSKNLFTRRSGLGRRFLWATQPAQEAFVYLCFFT